VAALRGRLAGLEAKLATRADRASTLTATTDNDPPSGSRGEGQGSEVELRKQEDARKQAEDRLIASELRFRRLFDAAPIGIATLYPDRTIGETNHALQEMLGWSDEELRGRDIREFCHPDQPAITTNALGHLAAKGGPNYTQHERRLIRRDGTELQVQYTASAARDDTGEFLYAILLVEDITERKRAEQELEHLYWRLTESKEEESRPIARERHDEIGQQLTGMKMQLQIGTPASTARALELTHELMNRATYLSLDLRPSVLDDLGLLPALRSQFNRFTEMTMVRVDFEYKLIVTNNGPSTATSLTVTDMLPAGVLFVSATTNCSEAAVGTVTCTAASLANGAKVEFTITVSPPNRFGNVSNTATVTAASPADPNSSNDSITLVTFVTVPPGVPRVGIGGFGALALALVALVLAARRRRPNAFAKVTIP
jgi:PAS domain S-box-containing protein/uncharacterized repeat protein (TIGR01451 family)